MWELTDAEKQANQAYIEAGIAKSKAYEAKVAKRVPSADPRTERPRRPEKCWWAGLFYSFRRRDMPPRYQGRRAKELLRFPVRSFGPIARRMLAQGGLLPAFMEYVSKIKDHKSPWLRPDAIWTEDEMLVIACSVCGDGNNGRYHYLLAQSTRDRIEQLHQTMRPDQTVDIALLDFYGSGICTRVEADKEAVAMLVRRLKASMAEYQPTEWLNVRIRVSPFSPGEAKRSEVDKALAVLEPLLAHGPVPASQVDAKREAAGLSKNAVHLASVILGVVKESHGRRGRIWTLPGHAEGDLQNSKVKAG